MSKFVKYTHMEAGPFTKTNNRIHIPFDADGVSNFKDSFLDVKLSFIKQNGSACEGLIQFGDQATSCTYDTSCLFKHVTLSSDKAGIIEENRFNNIRQQTMKQYNVSKEQRQSSVVFGDNQILIEDGKDIHVKVPLERLLGCGNTQVYPNARMGKSTLKLETEDVLQIANNSSLPHYTFTSPIEAIDNSGNNAPLDVTQITLTKVFGSDTSTRNDIFKVGNTISIVGNTLNLLRTISNVTFNGTNNAVLTIPTITIPATTNANALVLTQTAANPRTGFVNLQNTGAQPADVSQLFYVTATYPNANLNTNTVYNLIYNIQDGATTTVYVEQIRIKSVAVNPNDAIQTLVTLQHPLSNQIPGGGLATGMSLINIPEQVDYSIDDIELILSKPFKYNIPNQFNYITYGLEMVNMDAVSDFRKQFEIQANCSEIYILSPTSTLVSVRDNMSSYRNSINGFDRTDRDVDVSLFGPLYMDTLVNCLPDLRNLEPFNGDDQVFIVPERMPETGKENVIAVRQRFSQAATAKVLYVFKVLQMTV